MLIEMHECNGNSYARIGHIFVSRDEHNYFLSSFIALLCFALHVWCEFASKGEKKRAHERKQCIENGSLWRARSMSSFFQHFTLHIHRFHLRYRMGYRKVAWNMHAYGLIQGKALKDGLDGFFSRLLFSLCIKSKQDTKRLARTYTHTYTLPNKLAKKCEKVLISLIVVGSEEQRTSHSFCTQNKWMSGRRKKCKNKQCHCGAI